jgi:hypothetical protein
MSFARPGDFSLHENSLKIISRDGEKSTVTGKNLKDILVLFMFIITEDPVKENGAKF